MAEQSAKDAKRSRQDELVALAKRRGFFWPSYEIYGGLAGFYDYGPLGFLMKDNLVSLWKKYFVIKEGFLGIDSPIIGPEEVFRASGHLATFADLIVECSSKECNYAARVDHLAKEIVALNEEEGWQNEEVRKFKEILIGIAEERHKDPVFIGDIFSKVGVKCTLCGAELAIPKPFNLMFSTKVGPGKGKQGYLRPETAQSMFVNFLLLYRVNREKLPVGIVQIGRSFRNEIAPRQGMIRLREFNQAEAEIFFDPLSKDHPAFDSIANDRALFITGEGTVLKGATFGELVGNGTINSKALAYYMAITRRFLLDAGLSPQKIRFRQHKKSEMAHYASDCWDVEACLWAAAADEKGKADEGSLMNEQWLEIVGIADRTDYDLKSHIKVSGVDLSVFKKYPEPIVYEKVAVKPEPKKLGPLFKKDAKLIAEYLEKADERTAKAMAEAKSGGRTYDIVISNTSFQIPPDCYSVETVLKKETGRRFVPHVIEPSFGIDRIFFCLLEHTFHIHEGKRKADADASDGKQDNNTSSSREEDAGNNNKESIQNFGKDETENERLILLKLPPPIAPYKVGVFPLLNKKELCEVALRIDSALKARNIITYYDSADSIGRRYARMDECGTPWCITVDYQTLEDGTVTLRDRDDASQVRIKTDEVVKIIMEKLM